MVRLFVVAVLAFVGGVSACVLWSVGFGDRVIFERASAFNRVVRVFDESRVVRVLRFGSDRSVQSSAVAGRPLEGVLPYVARAVELAGSLDKVERVLVVGMGGGSMGMLMRARFPGAWIDLVEIDPVVVEASRYLGFVADERMRVTVGDGVEFVSRVVVPYDVVFLDAYDGVSVPDQFLRGAFFEALARAVGSGGVVISNVLVPGLNPGFVGVVELFRGAGFWLSSSVVVGGPGNCLFIARRVVGVGESSGSVQGGHCAI